MKKRFLIVAVACACALCCLALTGCGEKSAADDIHNAEITTGADGITNLDADALKAVYDEDILDLGMTMEECEAAMGGSPKHLTDPAYGDYTYSYYTSDGEYNICLGFRLNDDNSLTVSSLSTNLP
ncbi:MAG: hypothetical protein K6G78_06040 [bacterium]|nr:hypothetical protein [bacterium]